MAQQDDEVSSGHRHTGHGHVGATGDYRMAARDWWNGRDEMGIQSVHVAHFSHVSRFTGLWRWRTVSASR